MKLLSSIRLLCPLITFLLPLRPGPLLAMADEEDWYSPTGDIGQYFERKRNSSEGRCKICSKKFKDSNATTLRYHAKSQHRILIQKAGSFTKTASSTTTASSSSSAAISSPLSAATRPTPTQPSVKSMWEAKSKDSLGLVLSRLAALDFITFSGIAKSHDIREGLKVGKEWEYGLFTCFCL